jgi:hypothetical protein
MENDIEIWILKYQGMYIQFAVLIEEIRRRLRRASTNTILVFLLLRFPFRSAGSILAPVGYKETSAGQ